ncbi:cupin domain-containing protein [Sulfuricurvum sp.]|uniref:cupin domain-containing protein n=1 Tax=Sulfuricurvum sp. TaxID=2025608 RepID=UPI00262A0958|nr:cupin domain-containing protein [Sulfuricurvum sp.]MDD2837407.1 cupin [Sulfuricurvum sp.]MDD3596865.1 cupin [Sulfuricurvum sp.]
MQYCSFLADIVYGETQPVITPILVNDFTKEIRIVFRVGQAMKAHKTTFPITVMIVSGEIDFGIGEERMIFGSGDVVALEPNVIHDLVALEDSIVRLSLHKNDSVTRVNGVLKL